MKFFPVRLTSYFGLAVDAIDLLLRTPRTYRRPPIAPPLGINTAVTIFLSQLRQAVYCCGIFHCAQTIEINAVVWIAEDY